MIGQQTLLESPPALNDGANGANGRDPRDFYPTDPRVIEALLRLPLVLPKWSAPMVLEPACGKGNLVLPLDRRGFRVHAADLYSYPSEELPLLPLRKNEFRIEVLYEFGVDFLSHDWGSYDLVITNPPFSLAQEFVSTAMDVGRSTAMLLRLSMLGSITRCPWWQGLPPVKLQVLVPRPSFGLNKHGKKGTDNSEYAWFLWGPMFESLPPVGWLEWR